MAKAKTICGYGDCEKNAYSAGKCYGHYRSLRDTGRADTFDIARAKKEAEKGYKPQSPMIHTLLTRVWDAGIFA